MGTRNDAARQKGDGPKKTIGVAALRHAARERSGRVRVYRRVASGFRPPGARLSLRTYVVAALCVAACAALVAYKTLALGYSFHPRARDDRWSVQVTANATGRGERARVLLGLPTGPEAARVYDEHFSAPGLKLAIRPKKGARIATFSGGETAPGEPVSVLYRFSATAPAPEAAPEPARASDTDTSPGASIPADAPAVRAAATEVLGSASDDEARVRALYDFVQDEVAPGGESGTALDALREHRGGPAARTRLFVAMARSLGIPARLAHAVALREGTDRPVITRTDVLLAGRWTAVDPVRGRFGRDAEDGFVLARGDGEVVSAEGLDELRVDVTVARTAPNAEEEFLRLQAGRHNVVDRLSLQALPPRGQLVMRVLLLVPLGALIVALFRNLVGVPTFGTFAPILIALALRETRPLPGLGLLAFVLGLGFLGRRALEGLRLLVVPRLSLMLTLVIFLMCAAALAATHLGLASGAGIAVLPMVIMTMTNERLGVSLAEEGWRPALRTSAGTVLVAAAGYAAIQSDTLQRWVFVFPELNLGIAAALLLLGRYTGYRLSELVRFRAFAKGARP